MPLGHYEKKIDQLEKDFLFVKKGIENVQQATKREASLRVAIQGLASWIAQIRKKEGDESPLYLRANDLKERLKKQIQEVSAFILNSVNEEYKTNFSMEEMISGREGYYYQFGIMQTVQQSGKVYALFQKRLEDIIPSHPKDEFPLARFMKRVFHIHVGPTNSGKTYESLLALQKAEKGIYLSPLRLLALEVFEKLNGVNVPCDLLTGEEILLVKKAKHVSCTIEKANYEELFDVAVIDEGQMIGDTQRGFAWTRAVLGIRAHEIHICCAESVLPLVKKLIHDCDDEFLVTNHHRHTPLVMEDSPFLFPRDVQKGDAFIVFSRKKALQVAAELGQQQIRASVIYGNLPPETRRKQVDLFVHGETEVVVSTDAIGMGLNLPIRRIVFLESEKFDGAKVRGLLPQEVKQITGRAGRKGIYEQGFVNSISHKKEIGKNLRKKDEEIKFAYLLPHDSTILSLPFGSLAERLKAWIQYQIPVPYFKKGDITEILDLLNLAKPYENRLPIGQLYRAVTIPFDYKEKKLLAQWFLYLDCLRINRENLPKPRRRGSDLAALEIYYRAIGLYYSFTQAFGLKVDKPWIKRERERASEEIHHLLRNQLNTSLIR
jgi:ATP-dependent RNA helicase SUPV3L1/SUV3